SGAERLQAPGVTTQPQCHASSTQALRLRALSRSGAAPRLGPLGRRARYATRCARGQSNTGGGDLYGPLDASLSRGHAHGDTVAGAVRYRRAGEVSSHVRTLHVLLRLRPPEHVGGSGLVLRLARDGRGDREAQV